MELATIHDYYMLFNLVHYPAGVVPVTLVQEGEGEGTYIADSGKRWDDKLAHAIQRSEKGSQGMPLCVQVATPQWRDEECIAAMQIVDKCLGNFRPVLPTNLGFDDDEPKP